MSEGLSLARMETERQPTPRRDTRTGAVMERMILPALEMGGYEVRRNVHIGSRLGIAMHRIDTLATGVDGRVHLVSLKWQQVHGTAEQKIPFEIISLVDAMLRDERFHRAHLVLGGDGWRYKDFYLAGGLTPFLTRAELVHIASLEAFVRKANQGRL